MGPFKSDLPFAIDVDLDAAGQPRHLRFGGHSHAIQDVLDTWHDSPTHGDGVARRILKVRLDDGTLALLEQDIAQGAWTLRAWGLPG